MVVFDTSFLSLAFDKTWNAPSDPATGKPLFKAKERIDFLISSLDKSKDRILIPTPVLAEYLVKAGQDREKRLEIFTSSKVYDVATFGMREAVECSLIEDEDSRGKKVLNDVATKAKVKFDRQIIAIAKVAGATTIYTGDSRLARVAKDNGLDAVLTWELPLPPEKPQQELGLVVEGDESS